MPFAAADGSRREPEVGAAGAGTVCCACALEGDVAEDGAAEDIAAEEGAGEAGGVSTAAEGFGSNGFGTGLLLSSNAATAPPFEPRGKSNRSATNSANASTTTKKISPNMLFLAFTPIPQRRCITRCAPAGQKLHPKGM